MLNKKSLFLIFIFIIFLNFSLIHGEMDSFNSAENFYNDEFYDLAIEEYKNFINENPQDKRVETAYYKLMNSYYMTEKYNKLIYEAPRFIQQFRNSHYQGDVLFFLAKAYYEKGAIEKSKQLLDRIKRFNKNTTNYINAVFLLSKINKSNDNFDDYEKNLNYIIKLSPKDKYLKKVYKELVHLYFERKNYEKSEKYLNQLKEKDLENGEWLWLKSEILFKKNLLTKSRIHLDKIIKNYSDSKYYLYSLKRKGDIFYLRKNYTNALKFYNLVLDKNPNNKYSDDALKGIIDIHLELDNNSKALTKMEYFVKVYPGSEHSEYILNLLLKHYKKENSFNKVLSYYNKYLKTIKNNEKYMTIFLDKINYLTVNNKYKKAIENIIVFSHNNPNSKMRPFLIYRAGIIYGDKLNDYDRAITTLTQIRRNKDYGDQALYKIGNFYEKQERISKAIEIYKNIINNFEYSQFSKKASNRILYLNKYVKTDKDEAISMLNKLITDISDKNLSKEKIMKERAEIYFYLKDFENAKNYYKKINQNGENYFKTEIYSSLKNRKNKKFIQNFIRDNTKNGNLKIFNDLYNDILIFYEISNTLQKDDFIYYFNTFNKNISSEITYSYVNFLLNKGNTGEIINFEIPGNLNPSVVKLIEGLKMFYSKNYGKSKQTFTELLNKDIEYKNIIYYHLANINFITNNYNESKKYIFKIKNDLHYKIKSSILLAKINYKNGNFDEVKFNLYNVLQRNPEYYNDYEVVSIYINSLKKENKDDLIRITLNKIDEKDNEDLKALKGINFIEIGDVQKGETLLTQLKSEEAKSKLYDYYFNNNKWNKIIKYFNTSSNYDISRSIIAYLKEGKIQRAKSLFSTYNNKINRFKPELDYFFGEYYYYQEKSHNDALKYLNYIIKNYESTEWIDDALYLKGNIYISTGKNNEANELFQDLIESYPATNLKDKVFLSLGQLNFNNGNFKKAVDYFEKSYSISKNNHTYYNLGLAHKKLKNYNRAKKIFKQISEKKNLDTLKYDSKLNQAYILMDQQEYNQAISVLENLLESAPIEYHLEIQYHIGECYFSLKKYNKAIREYLKVKYYYNYESEFNFQWLVTALFKAGQTYEIQNKYKNATKIYKNIMEISGEKTTYYKTAKNRIEKISNY